MLSRYLPILEWGRTYNRNILTDDLMAAVIVTIMLIPQSLAYALLAGLPPVVGLYASILPLVLYAIFGTSRTLAVGPVAVVSLMTASAAGAVAAQGTAEYLEAAITLAMLSGVMLAILGFLRAGFLANLLSHPVISGFITASGILIATSQLKHILGITAGGDNWPDMLGSLAASIGETNVWTLAIGIPATLFLFWVRKGAKPALQRVGLAPRAADMTAKAGPVVAVALTILAVIAFDLGERNVNLVGAIPQGLPPFALPSTDLSLIEKLWVPALLISIIGFVESVSVAQTLAAKRRQRIAPDQELIGLGAANIASAFSGGYPVTGGFARSAVNFDAGAQTPAAGAYTAVGIALATLFLTPLLFSLPIATLAATIIVAVLSLVDLKTPSRLWHYSKADFAAHIATIAITLLAGVEMGVIAGVGVGLLLYLWRASRPHAAIVGRVPETEHFRNVDRHKVFTVPHILSIRIDEALTYLNARWLEEYVLEEVADRPAVRHVILMCSAVNEIDASGLESLEAINHRLGDGKIGLHLSEVKGPVMDRLKRSHFIEELNGEVFLSQSRAFDKLINDDGAPPEPVDHYEARGLI
ncbi:sulfate permease [Erythrobacter sp. SCSIO 43205]|uniref:SulP family inorganic anion transporter n=1 Tax=Erythrobacter sp. SCSIO 43205 TaxID=2779361 RepID=UPI001CA99BE4|nr:sulfate permease [Erythrobacter sp. SCSIO 43205]UAB78852.1 sulfate permease [Erythrobacter sp. SCSIO 43205]